MRSTLSIVLLPVLVAAGAAASCSAGSSGSSSSQGGTGGPSTGGAGGTGGAGASGGDGGVGGVGGATTGSGGMASGTGGGPVGCQDNTDCAGDPNGEVCDTSTGFCVGCIPTDDPIANDDCGQGQYCNKGTQTCQVGCTSNFDCMLGSQACDVLSNVCVGCVIDTDCAGGSICISNKCVPGCSGTQPCQAGFSCCGSSCYDFSSDENNCGFCNNACPDYYLSNPNDPNSKVSLNGAPLCDNGLCGVGTCKTGFADCNLDPNDGCEWNTLQDGACTCVPGQKQPCYQGAPGTVNVGACKGGTQTCKADGSGWGACVGQVLPKPEICGNTIDDDCNGTSDDNVDLDGDGWTSCGGDCCDSFAPGCANPKGINPGAFEYPGDGQDNDCDTTTLDTAPQLCSTDEKFTTVLGADVAKAMELCQFTTESPPQPQKRWGVISADQILANGTTPTTTQLQNIQNKQTAVLKAYGTNVLPLKGATMAGISTGVMRDQDDVGYAGVSTSFNTSSQPPAAYLLANGGKLPNSKGCSGTCLAGTGANDPVNVKLRIRTPTNAKSFTYAFRFFSSEYWNYQCQPFNDFFLALYKSTWKPDPLAMPPQTALPLDKNVATDSQGNPISVNNGFFDVCAPKGCNVCPAGFSDLFGTGLQIGNAGGATKWLYNDIPMIPGEIIELELMVFDVADAVNDSIILLDNFTWNVDVKIGLHE